MANSLKEALAEAFNSDDEYPEALLEWSKNPFDLLAVDKLIELVDECESEFQHSMGEGV